MPPAAVLLLLPSWSHPLLPLFPPIPQQLIDYLIEGQYQRYLERRGGVMPHTLACHEQANDGDEHNHHAAVVGAIASMHTSQAHMAAAPPAAAHKHGHGHGHAHAAADADLEGASASDDGERASQAKAVVSLCPAASLCVLCPPLLTLPLPPPLLPRLPPPRPQRPAPRTATAASRSSRTRTRRTRRRWWASTSWRRASSSTAVRGQPRRR